MVTQWRFPGKVFASQDELNTWNNIMRSRGMESWPEEMPLSTAQAPGYSANFDQAEIGSFYGFSDAGMNGMNGRASGVSDVDAFTDDVTVPPDIDVEVRAAGAQGALAVAGGVALSLAGIAARAPILAAALARAFVAMGLVRGTRVLWSRVPRWLQLALGVLGVQVGTDILFDFGVDDIGIIQVPGTSDAVAIGDPIGAMVQAMTVGTWTANGVVFHRLSDGRFAVRNKHGVWKVWRPKKPIVLFATGQQDLRTLLRADKLLHKEGKKIAKMLRNRGYGVARS